MNNLIKEFKEFAMKGNVIDMAIGVAIGAAFNNIVNSLVNDIITPIFAALTSDVEFSELSIVLKQTSDGTITLKYGSFLEYVFDFIIVAFSIFLTIKVINKVRRIEGKDDIKPEIKS